MSIPSTLILSAVKLDGPTVTLNIASILEPYVPFAVVMFEFNLVGEYITRDVLEPVSSLSRA